MSYLPQFLYGLSRADMEMFMNDDDPFLFLGASFFCVFLLHSLIDVISLSSNRRRLLCTHWLVHLWQGTCLQSELFFGL
jgi:hypothetical protein